MKMRLADLKIDEDFKNLLPELDAETYTDLEKDIVANGMIDPIVIWNGFIADGHNRYSICKAHRVTEVEVKELRKNTKSDVMQWIVDHQFSKRNLLLSQKYTLLSKVKEQVEKEAAERRKATQNNATAKAVSPNLDEQAKGRTDEIMAKKLGVSRNTYRDIDTVMKQGTQEKIARMDKGGRGNSASAIAKEIKEGVPDGYRKCRSCGKTKKIELFKQGEALCKECRNKQDAERNKNNVSAIKKDGVNASGCRKCNKCGRIKLVSEFCLLRGHTNICKQCINDDAIERARLKKENSDIGKIISMLKDDERDISNTENETKDAVNMLIESFKNSLESTISNNAYNKEDIVTILHNFADYITEMEGKI